MAALLLFLLQDPADLGPVPAFTLTDRSGRTLTADDLRGKVWIADFVFTRCATVCPAMSHKMKELQDELPLQMRFVSFSVDPERDTPEVLRDYAEQLKASPARWFFLTGTKKQIFDVAWGFHLTAKDPESGSDQVGHDLRFVLVDRNGRIRGYHDFRDTERLQADARKLLTAFGVVPTWWLPAVNAGLNASSAILLLIGFAFIKSKKTVLHKACMLAAVGVSLTFLAGYIVYHVHAGSMPFGGQGALRPVYFTILISHTALAITLVPLVIVTLRRAFRGNFEKHRKIAWVTFPLWLYVSVSGVVVYLMLYHFYPPV